MRARIESDKGNDGGLDEACATNCSGMKGAAKMNSKTGRRNDDCNKIGSPSGDGELENQLSIRHQIFHELMERYRY